ncbi:type II secretion system secretin GspD [Maricaulaceae bacterium EIL42A08]|nr:type II secretion system secretin GspD [Maricaulaceae bacterium EIL42A08]
MIAKRLAKLQTVALAAVLSLGLIASLPAAGIAQQSGAQTLNFRDTEIAAVIEDVSRLTGYTFIVDPEVRGRITITSQSPLTPEEVFQVFLSTLRVNGYAAVRTAPGVFQIVPIAEGARAGAPVGGARDGDVFLTSVFRLTNTSARDAVRAIGPMISGNGAANAVEGGNLIVVVDFASNVQSIEEVLRAMDVDRSTVEMLVLENIPAEDMVSIVERLRTRTAQGEDDRAFAVTVAAVPASNALLMRGEPRAVGEMIALARRVDAVSASNQSFRVVYLDHAEGEQLLPILEQFAEALTPGEAGSGRPISIAHHAPTNAIILNADPDLLRELEQVIGRLDIRRPQVQVEAIVVEISDQAARDLGVQFLLSGDGSNATPFGYTRYDSSTSPDLLALAGALITDGFSDDTTSSAGGANLRELALASLFGARGGSFGVGGEIGDTGALFGVVLNALEADTDSNVLSKPQVTVLDNEAASLIVGQQIPITTGESLGANNANPFRQIERQDVGVKLEVTPQINDGDTIRLNIVQEVSSVAGPVSANFQELITNTRQISTTVLADNGEIIVLGGLIETDEQVATDAVPGLSRLPVAGRLFQNQARSTTRRNLMVFLRPVIIRGPEDMRRVTRNAYDYSVAAQRAADDGRSSLDDLVDMMLDGEAAFDRPLPAREEGN